MSDELDARLEQLLDDAEAEAAEAKALKEQADARHKRASERAKAIRTAYEQTHGTPRNGRPPDPGNGEAVDTEHAERVLQARDGEAA